MDAKTKRHNELRRWRESRQKEGRQQRFLEEWSELLRDPGTDLSEFSVRGMFEAFVDDGREWIDTYCGPNSGGFRMTEAGGLVNTGLFANTQGQYIYNAVLQAYEKPELIGDSLFTIQQSSEVAEKIPGVAELGDEVEIVNEGEAYGNSVVQECWIETPETIKRGRIINVTKEVLFFDKTNLILQRASNVGEMIAINREKRMLDVALGIATVYKRNGQPAEATYQAENTTTTNALTDYTSLDEADTKFMGITDPDTGEPISITANTLIVPPALRNTAMRILNSMMTNSTSGSIETRVGSNSLNQPYRYVTNQYVKNRGGSDTTWWYGNPKAALVYMQNWPLTVENEGPNGPAAFDRDVVARYKCSERGAAGVRERRYMLKATA